MTKASTKYLKKLQGEFRYRLQRLVSEIAEAADYHEMSYEDMAYDAGLCTSTVYRLYSPDKATRTKEPRFSTVMKLAIAVGFDMTLVEEDLGLKAAA
tara:strand:- start:21 stop:311 length:291 start_codon:yes stop_codon:yes gene_type:complete